MLDGQGRRSPSPDFNPLNAFLGAGDDDENDGELIPAQLPSIIDEKAIVRYYRDGKRTPVILSDGHQGTAPATASHKHEDADGSDKESHFDIALALDVTTGCGGKIWPAAEVLGAYIASKRSQGQWKGKTAVELGAGTGLVGLLAARLDILDQVWITDQVPMLKLMQQNLDLNHGLEKHCTVAELNWGESIPDDVPQKPDILLLADCVYLEIAFQPLADTMVEMSTPDTEILFCYQQRRKADKRFFKMLRKSFHFTDVLDDDEGRKKHYTRQGTYLFRITKKSNIMS